jgi:hypothetical protein
MSDLPAHSDGDPGPDEYDGQVSNRSTPEPDVELDFPMDPVPTPSGESRAEFRFRPGAHVNEDPHALRADLSGHGWWRWPIFGEDLIASSRRRLPELRSAGYRSAAVSISFAV